MGRPPCHLALPLVPSKAALRALRILARSPSTLLFAPSGSTCGIAGLTCNFRRERNIAQQRIERRHGLHSVRSKTADTHYLNPFTNTEHKRDRTLRLEGRHSCKSPALETLNGGGRQQAHEEDLGSRARRKFRNQERGFNCFRPLEDASLRKRRTLKPRISDHEAQPQLEPARHAWSDSSREVESKDLRAYHINTATDPSPDHTCDANQPPWLIEPYRLKTIILADRELSGLSHGLSGSPLDVPATLHDFPPSSRNASQQLKKLIGDDIHDKTLDFIFQKRRHLRLEIARWHLVLQYFLAQDNDNRMVIASAIVSMLRFAFPIEVCTFPTVLKIVEHHLSDESSFEQAAELLFPSPCLPMSPASQKTNDSFLAIAYLTNFLETHQDFELWIAELRKVFLAAELSEVSLGVDFATPIIKALCHAGNMDRVFLTLDELEKRYGIAVTLDSLKDLSNGYAVAGNWKEAASVIELMHDRGHSRKHPDRFQSFYAKLIELFSKDNTAESCLGFTVSAIKNAGLIPGSRVSRAITCASIRDGRHELILEWGRLVDKLYSRLDPPFSTLESALQFSEVCRNIGASCVEIASACRAMVHRARKDPFSKYFRGCISSLVREDLIYRLRAINQLNQSLPDDFETKSTDALLDLGRELKQSQSRVYSVRPTETKLLRDLTRQIDAVEELKTTLEGGVSMIDLYESDDSRRRTPGYQDLRRPSPGSRGLDQPPDSTPESLKQNALPVYPAIVEAVLNDYISRRRLGETPDHSLLKFVVRKLARYFRGADAMRLICLIYQSDHVKGVHGIAFDEEIFTTWIHLALESGRAQDTVTALWAIIDSIRVLDFSHDFRLLTLFAFVTEHRRLFGIGAKEWTWKNSRDGELEYAYKKLATANGRDFSRTAHSNIFPAWKRWEEAMRDRVTAEW